MTPCAQLAYVAFIGPWPCLPHPGKAFLGRERSQHSWGQSQSTTIGSRTALCQSNSCGSCATSQPGTEFTSSPTCSNPQFIDPHFRLTSSSSSSSTNVRHTSILPGCCRHSARFFSLPPITFITLCPPPPTAHPRNSSLLEPTPTYSPAPPACLSSQGCYPRRRNTGAINAWDEAIGPNKI